MHIHKIQNQSDMKPTPTHKQSTIYKTSKSFPLHTSVYMKNVLLFSLVFCFASNPAQKPVSNPKPRVFCKTPHNDSSQFVADRRLKRYSRASHTFALAFPAYEICFRVVRDRFWYTTNHHPLLYIVRALVL